MFNRFGGIFGNYCLVLKCIIRRDMNNSLEILYWFSSCKVIGSVVGKVKRKCLKFFI